MNKEQIRKDISDRKKCMSRKDIESRSCMLSACLFQLDEYKKADTVLVYMSANEEVITEPIIRNALKSGKKVAVPKTYPGRVMEFVYIDENTVFEKKHGIKEPVSGEIADCDAIMVVPGLAFDKNNNRIGYGGGYYDRYFEAHRHRNIYKVALCYDFQLFDELEVDPHDERVDVVFSY